MSSWQKSDAHAQFEGKKEKEKLEKLDVPSQSDYDCMEDIIIDHVLFIS